LRILDTANTNSAEQQIHGGNGLDSIAAATPRFRGRVPPKLKN
jgi:hypothetical protein